MQIHEVTAKLRPELEMRHPSAEVVFGAVFNTEDLHKDTGTAYVRIASKPYQVDYEIHFGAVKLECVPLFSEALEDAA